jgi:hypothetical protein
MDVLLGRGLPAVEVAKQARSPDGPFRVRCREEVTQLSICSRLSSRLSVPAPGFPHPRDSSRALSRHRHIPSRHGGHVHQEPVNS